MVKLRIALFVTFAVLFIACQNKPDLIGTWQIDQENSSKDYQDPFISKATFTLNADSTFSMFFIENSYSGKFKLSEKGTEIIFSDFKKGSLVGPDIWKYKDYKNPFKVSLITHTKETLKIGKFHDASEEGVRLSDSKDYSTWKR